MARNPVAAMKTLQRQFDKHCRQVHMREDASQAADYEELRMREAEN